MLTGRPKTMRDYVLLTTLAFIVAVLVRFFIAQPFVVSGDSMEPTFTPGQYLVIDELTYMTHAPQRGDVAVFRYPLDPSVYFIKRIIGVPGDVVAVHNGAVTIRPKGATSTAALVEPYILPAIQKLDTSTTTLGADEYFVMGDNRNESFDSRIWGPVPGRYMIGRAWLRLFPVWAVARLPGQHHFDNIGTTTIHSK